MMMIEFALPRENLILSETLDQSPLDGFVDLSTPPPPPPPPPPAPPLPGSTDNFILLPHQQVHLILNRENQPEIQARSVPTMFMNNENIWTRCVLPNLRIKQSIFDRHYCQSPTLNSSRYRRASVSTSSVAGGGGGTSGSLILNDDSLLSFVLLDATSKMLYDVPMRHLVQLVKKDYDDDATIDHVIHAIDQAQMKSEWLDAVIALNKQFDKRPEDKARVLAHKGSTHGLVLIEQFFVKLVRVPAYEFKLIYLKFVEEAPTQLERMSKYINDLLESIETILINEQLPGILHLLCLLYNNITGKQIPGLHFDSLLSVLATRTAKQNTTIAHLLCHLLEEQYPNLLTIFDHQILLKLKDLSVIKYIPIYIDIRLLYTRYKQLNDSIHDLEQQMIRLPEHIKHKLDDLQVFFTKLFDNEIKVKDGEKHLSNYFCLWDLSLEVCLSTLGQFIEKLRLAHMQNLEQRRRIDLLNRQQRTVQTPTRSLRSNITQYSSETNIFRDHLNVPLTPMTSRQRSKMNRTFRDRFSVSSRDVSHVNDEKPQQIVQNLLANGPPRKRGHSPTARTVFTKRPFNVLGSSLMKNPTDELDDVFLPDGTDESSAIVKMDCSTDPNDSFSSDITCVVPSRNLIPFDQNFLSSSAIRRQYESHSDQSLPIETTESTTPLLYDSDRLTEVELKNRLDEYDKENHRDMDFQPLTSASNSIQPTGVKDDHSSSSNSDKSDNEFHSELEVKNSFDHSESHDESSQSSSNQNSNSISVKPIVQTKKVIGKDNSNTSKTSKTNNVDLKRSHAVNKSNLNRNKISTLPSSSPKCSTSVAPEKTNLVNTRLNSNIQRCAVSRQVCVAKENDSTVKVRGKIIASETVEKSSRLHLLNKTKPSIRPARCSPVKTSSFIRTGEKPLRAFPILTNLNDEPPLTTPRKVVAKTSNLSCHPVLSQKSSTNKTFHVHAHPTSTFVS